jgi:hypothetical protein
MPPDYISAFEKFGVVGLTLGMVLYFGAKYFNAQQAREEKREARLEKVEEWVRTELLTGLGANTDAMNKNAACTQQLEQTLSEWARSRPCLLDRRDMGRE